MTSYKQAKAGGNDMSAVGVLGAAASNFDNVTNVIKNKIHVTVDLLRNLD